MGSWWGFLFGEVDTILIKEIAKEHNIDEKIVAEHYKTMLENIKNEVQK